MSKINENRNKKLISQADCPENSELEVQLAHALRTVLEWPNPEGKIQEYYIPKWLASQGIEALQRFYSNYED